MGRWVVWFLVLLIVVETGSWVFVYDSMSRSIASLEDENKRLRGWLDSNTSSLREVSNMYADLQRRYDALVDEHNVLRDSYSRLLSEHDVLRSLYEGLQARYDSVYLSALELNSSLAWLAETQISMVYVPEAFRRVLNLTNVVRVAPYVSKAGVISSDLWTSLQNIYKWITTNVAYVWDVPVLAPVNVSCDESGLCTYGFKLVRNYVQEPWFTAEYGQGDCDDQAVLAYAMIKYYMIFVHGREYYVWLAYVEFASSEVAHLTVFIPASGGELIIFDPAGRYLTRDQSGRMTSRPSLNELQRYSSYFSDCGGISYIEIYEVDVTTGQYTTLVKGNITEIASYITQLASET